MTLWEDNNIDYEFADLIHEKQEGQRLKIKKHIIHPNYTMKLNKSSDIEYDIAIVITENIGELFIFDNSLPNPNIEQITNNFN